ncbi:MAG: deoxyribonuclease IV [Patescibacteria group bacterium]
MIKIGAHLSVAGGYHNALNKIVSIGGNCLQVFACSPRSWSFMPPSQEQIVQFVTLKEKLEIDPVYFHASYLINLANEPHFARNACNSLVNEMNLAPNMQVRGSIVHLGSFKTKDGFDLNTYDVNGYLISNIKKVLESTPSELLLIIENAGNKKVGQSLEEISHIMEKVDNDRVRVCLDSCHAYSAGYDLTSEHKLDAFIQKFDSLIGLNKLELFHLNDSRDLFDSGRDRHANIGEGTLGLDTFGLILNHPKLKHLPFLIETPGFDDKGPDKQNIDILKSLIK